MKTSIQRSFDALNKESGHHLQHSQSEQPDLQPEKIQCFPDRELFESLPVLLKYFPLKVLHTLANTVTGKPYHCNRKRTIRKIQLGLSALFAQTGEDVSESLQKVQHILRNPNYIRRNQGASVLKEMPPSCLAAAQSTLNQLEKFPIRTLYAMGRKMRRKSHAIKLDSKHKSGNRNMLAEKMKKRGEKLLENVSEGDPLPESLNKALLVASLSARQICGKDGGLLRHLGPIASEREALQNDFLKAILHVQKLKYLELKDIYNCFSSDNRFSSKNLHILQNKIRTVLIDWLFESVETPVPEPIIRSVNMINKLSAGKQESVGERNPSSYKTEGRVEVELECVLNVSSHLQRIIWDWAESAGLNQEFTDVNLDDSNEDCEPWFTENSGNLLTSAGHEEAYVGESTWEPEFAQSQEPVLREHQEKEFDGPDYKNGSQKGDSSHDCIKHVERNRCHTQKDGGEGNMQEQIQGICDEAGLFAYHLLGCMMDGFLSRRGDLLEFPTKAYLRAGVPDFADNRVKSESPDYQEDIDTSMLLNVAENLMPQMPGSVIKRVKHSLGVL
eukprot:Gb_01478 [translate_table: standard]